MRKKWEISRRTFLKGSGVAIALPLLESMIPIARAEAAAPKRLVYVFANIGVEMSAWLGSAANLSTLSPTLAPLAPYKSHLLLLNGMDSKPCESQGGGDHASAAGGYLTGVQIGRAHV